SCRASLCAASVTICLLQVVSETSSFHPNCAIPRHDYPPQRGQQSRRNVDVSLTTPGETTATMGTTCGCEVPARAGEVDRVESARASSRACDRLPCHLSRHLRRTTR